MQNYLLMLGKSYLKSYAGLPTSCWRGVALSLTESTLMGVFYFLSIYFVNDLHIDIATAGRIISCWGLGAIVGGYLGGKLSDKISPGNTLAYSLLIQAIGYLLLIKIQTPNLLMVNLFVLGGATYSSITSNYTWVLKQCAEVEPQRLKAINILSTASNLGLGLSAVIISLVARYGFQYIFAMSGLIIASVAGYLILQERKQDKPNVIKPNSINSSNPHTDLAIKHNDRAIIMVVLGCVLSIGSVVSQLNSTYPIYINATFPHLGINAVGILFTLNSLIVVLFETPIGNIIGNYNKIFMIRLSSFFIGFGMLMLSFSSLFSFAILACIIYTLGEIVFFCMAQLICYQKAEGNKKGHNLGLYRMVYATSRVVGPACGGYIYLQFGGNIVWYVCGVVGFMSLIVCNYYRKSESF